MAIKNLDKIAAHLGVDKDEFINMIQSEDEHEIQIPERTVKFDPDAFAEDEGFNTWKENYKRENHNAMREIMVKEAKRDLGKKYENLDNNPYNFEGKDLNKLLEVHAQETLRSAKIEPEKKVAELQKDLETFRNKVQEYESQIQTINQEKENIKFEFSLKDRLSSTLKNISGEKIIPEDEIIDLYRMKRDIKSGENGFNIVDKSTNEIKKNSMLEPISLESDFEEFVASRYVKKPDGGRGEGNTGGVAKNTIEAFDKQMQSEGKKIGGEEYNKILMQKVQAGELDLSE